MFGPRVQACRKRALNNILLWSVLFLCVTGFLLSQCATRATEPAHASPPSASGMQSHHPSGHVGHGTGEGRPVDTGDLSASVHVALGVPIDSDSSDDRLIDEHSYVLSYSPVKRVPNWVAWRLDRSYLGHVRRRNTFRPDPALPSELYHVSERDYIHSGYDRGHMCPSADREATPEDNSTTFLFTNIEPQLHELNAGPWEKFESYERVLAARPGAVLYIVAGGVFSEPFPTIGQGVAVPAANFKIVVLLADGQRASDVRPETQVLGVLMPNQAGVGGHDWGEFLTSVDAIERATGYDFLSAIPEPVQRIIEARTGRP